MSESSTQEWQVRQLRTEESKSTPERKGDLTLDYIRKSVIVIHLSNKLKEKNIIIT